MKPKRGRPPKGEYADKSAVMNFRIRPDTKRLLQQAALASGRTLSQETEHQLRRALVDMRDGPTYALMKTIGAAIDSITNLKEGEARWLDDAYLYDQATRIIAAAVEMFRPPAAQEVSADQSEEGGTRQGRFAIETTLREIQTVDPSKPFSRQTHHERWLSMLKQDLGDLVDRPSVWGRSAEEAREQKKLGDEVRRDVLPELIPLQRKAAEATRGGAPLTEPEKEKLAHLLGMLAGKLQHWKE